MHPEELFRANLTLIDRVIAGVCRRAGLRDADAEDFASTAKLAMIENDYAILRAYEGRAPLGAFLTVVVQRMLSERAARVVRETIAALPLQDRMLIRFHFGAELSIADTARVLGVPQRPLYRRIEALLARLRRELEHAGLGSPAVEDVISAGS